MTPGEAFVEQADRLRETLVQGFYMQVQEAVFEAVKPIFEQGPRIIDLEQLKTTIEATNQNETPLNEVIQSMYVKAGVMAATLTADQFEKHYKSDFTEAVAEPTYFQRFMVSLATKIGAEKVTLITATNRKILQDIVVAAVENGWSVQRTVSHMVTFFEGELSVSRALMIARTEILTASSAAGFEVGQKLQEYGINVKKKWLHSSQENFRPTHLAMDGVPPIGLNEYFNVGGVQMLHPHEAGAPASEVINCRCTHYFVPF